MKGLVMAVLDVVVVLSLLAVGGSAASAEAAASVGGPYEGMFRGIAYGDGASKAPLELELMHRSNQVTGTVSIGEGLYVDGGLCGAVHVPAVEQPIAGETLLKDARRLEATPVFDLGSFDLKVDFQSTVSASGDTISARVKLDLPWFCGRDPVLTATVHRDQSAME